MRLQRKQPFERRLGPIALVLIAAHLLCPDHLAGLLIEHTSGDLDGRDLAFEEALLLRPRCALLARDRILVLDLATDVIALRHYFSRVSHNHVDAGIPFLHHRMGIIVARRHADAFNAAADSRVDAFHHDLMRRHRDRLQTR